MKNARYMDRTDFLGVRRSFWAEEVEAQHLEEIWEKNVLEGLQDVADSRILIKAQKKKRRKSESLKEKKKRIFTLIIIRSFSF